MVAFLDVFSNAQEALAAEYTNILEPGRGSCGLRVTFKISAKVRSYYVHLCLQNES